MTIEILRKESKYIYRINEFNNREIDKRKNKRGARWERHQICTSPESARRILLKLQQEDDEE